MVYFTTHKSFDHSDEPKLLWALHSIIVKSGCAPYKKSLKLLVLLIHERQQDAPPTMPLLFQPNLCSKWSENMMVAQLCRRHDGWPKEILSQNQNYTPTCMRSLHALKWSEYYNLWTLPKCFSVHHLDIKRALRHALLLRNKRVRIKLAYHESVTSVSGNIIQLNISLNVLKQAPKLWYEYFKNNVYNIGLTRSRSCYSLLIASSGDRLT